MTYEDMLKPALVDLAIQRGVLKNKSAGRTANKQELCEQLAAQDRVEAINKANAATVEHEVEVDGRHLADIPSVPGAMAYGETPEAAERAARDIATEALAVPSTIPAPPEPAASLPPPAFVPHGGSRVSILAPATDPRHPACVPPALAAPRAAPAPIPGVMAEERVRVRLTTDQRANKLRRNKRRHKRALLRERGGRTSGQGPIHA
jgi:predicted RNase H-like HicB family nuclease